ncbi:MAG: hypothetical protein RJA44_2221 [Pseudomonadota bacterium]|jgi:uncharacterized RDD family membrane protein YckC
MFVHAPPPLLNGQTPGLRRRLAAMLYEGVILFGVVTFCGLIYAGLTHQVHALQGRLGLQLSLLTVLSLYFVWFWTHSGQTVAMKTWHIRVEAVDGAPLRPARALLRYLLSWLWFAPPLLGLWLGDRHDSASIWMALGCWMLVYALLSQLLPQRQFLHDVLSHTRLATFRPAA